MSSIVFRFLFLPVYSSSSSLGPLFFLRSLCPFRAFQFLDLSLAAAKSRPRAERLRSESSLGILAEPWKTARYDRKRKEDSERWNVDCNSEGCSCPGPRIKQRYINVTSGCACGLSSAAVDRVQRAGYIGSGRR